MAIEHLKYEMKQAINSNEERKIANKEAFKQAVLKDFKDFYKKNVGKINAKIEPMSAEAYNELIKRELERE